MGAGIGANKGEMTDDERAYKAAYMRDYRKKRPDVMRRAQHKSNRTDVVRWRDAKRKAPGRGIVWDLSFEDWKRTVGLNRCAYCEGPLPEAGCGIDRKDSSAGYTVDNVVPCCHRCNTMKGALLTYDEMMLIWERRKAA